MASLSVPLCVCVCSHVNNSQLSPSDLLFQWKSDTCVDCWAGGSGRFTHSNLLRPSWYMSRVCKCVCACVHACVALMQGRKSAKTCCPLSCSFYMLWSLDALWRFWLQFAADNCCFLVSLQNLPPTFTQCNSTTHFSTLRYFDFVMI